MDGSQRIVVFAPNWLGDAVMALPAIADVVRGSRGTPVDVAARASVAPLFPLVAGVGEVVTLRRRRALTTDVARLRDRYHTALVLPNSFQSAFAIWRAGIPERWGYRGDFRGPLLTRAIDKPKRGHQAAYYQNLTSALGFERGPLEPRIEVSEPLRKAGAELLISAGWDGRTSLMALAPGAAYGGAKRWPAQSFAELAHRLAKNGVITALVGSAGDRAAGEPYPFSAINLIGRTDLPTLAGVLSNCRGLISNDSGAMHFAAALSVRVTAMFGPTEEWATRPLGRIEPTILIHDVWCRPCMLRECPLDHRCMRGITVDAVLAAAS
jgi:lipopolysaccharide heptosyltransferase II